MESEERIVTAAGAVGASGSRGLRADGRPGAGKARTRPPVFFHAMRETPCPYLAGRRERKLLVDLDRADARALYSELSRAGFRRSHGIAYRPACSGCRACVPVRVRVADFVARRSLGRVARHNRDLAAEQRPAVATGEQFRLFHDYLARRHAEGEMVSMTPEDYRAMVEDTRLDTRVLELRDAAGTLVAGCIVDWLEDGPSAVYSFFAPRLAARSLGSFVVLSLIEGAAASGLPYVYLGYWIEGAAKMDYKIRFRPLEGLFPEGWREL